MTLGLSGMLKAGVNIKYLYELVHGEALRQFDALTADVEGSTPVILEYIILGLGTYFYLLMRCPRKSAQCAVKQGSRTV